MVTVKETIESMVKNFNSGPAKGWDRVLQITVTGEGRSLDFKFIPK